MQTIQLVIEASVQLQPDSIECRFNGPAVPLTLMPNGIEAVADLLDPDWFEVGENEVGL